MIVPYRDNSLLTVDIKCEIHNSFNKTWTPVRVDFRGDGFHHHTIVFYDGIEIDEWEGWKVSEGNILFETHRLARWLVITGQYERMEKVDGYKHSEIHIGSARNESTALRYSVSKGKFNLKYSPLERLAIEESKLARKIIIAEIYRSGTLSRSGIHANANFPKEAIEKEINALNASRYVAINQEEGLHFLTVEGREHFESGLINSGIGFIIAACKPMTKAGKAITKEEVVKSHQQVIDLYRETLSNSGLQPIFQEYEETRKNIIVDIFDYIDSAEVVVVDLTWERPNCYIEIGYAISKQKPIVLFIEEGYFKSKMKKSLPFDISVIRYRTYNYGDEGLKKLEDLLIESLQKIRERQGRI